MCPKMQEFGLESLVFNSSSAWKYKDINNLCPTHKLSSFINSFTSFVGGSEVFFRFRLQYYLYYNHCHL